MARFKDSRFAEMKRRAILDAATEEFQAKGPDKASMRAIAGKAGMTTGAIYSMFEGKDDLYAALLLESLERLEAFVAARVAAADSPEQAVRASVEGFFVYYKDRPFEIQLGMYSFAGLSHGSLGRERDDMLNAALLATLERIGATIAGAAPHLDAEGVRKERDAIFSCLFGVLSLAQTGRAISIGTTPETVLETHVTSLLDRLRRA